MMNCHANTEPSGGAVLPYLGASELNKTSHVETWGACERVGLVHEYPYIFMIERFLFDDQNLRLLSEGPSKEIGPFIHCNNKLFNYYVTLLLSRAKL